MFQCVEERGLDVEEVNTCFTSTEGYQLMLKAEKETKAMTPGPLFVPTIVFDDVRNCFYTFFKFITLKLFCIKFVTFFFFRNTTTTIKTKRSQTSNRYFVRN